MWIECHFRHIQQGRAPRLIVGNTNITTDASRQAILKAIARARLWYDQLTTGQATSIAKLASIHGVCPRFVRMHMKLVQLSPESIERMLDRSDSFPPSLDDLLATIPMNWNVQLIGSSAISA